MRGKLRIYALLAPFGAAERFVFKGARPGTDLRWYDYLVEFGPGSRLKFSIALDDDKKIVSISYG